MEYRTIFAGFGGQGIISMGTLTSYTGMEEGKNVTFYPAYGIAMRGGTANCSVIVSDDIIASPIITDPNVMVVMNEPSLEFFQDRIEKDGVLITNSSLVKIETSRNDLKVYKVPASEIAEHLGNGKMANMAMMGAYAKITGIVKVESLFKMMEKTFPPKLMKLLDINKQAMQKGYDSLEA